MKNTTHQPIFLIVAAYSLGIILSQFQGISLQMILFLSLASLILMLMLFRRTWAFKITLIFLFVCLGLISTKALQMPWPDDVRFMSYEQRQEITNIRGTIVSEIEFKEKENRQKTIFELRVDAIKTPEEWQKRSGKVLVNIFKPAPLAYGDVIHVEGKLHTPFDFKSKTPFSYREYLNRRGIRFIFSVKKTSSVIVENRGEGQWLKSKALALREKLKPLLIKYLSPNEAAIMQAILLGERTGIPKHVMDLFINTGTIHILAISGMNIGIVAGIFLLLLKLLPVGRKWHLILAFILVLGYTLLTGASPSVVRAAIMTTIVLGGFILEKEQDLLNSLFAAALIILLIDPLSLFNIGFQLSFICVLAIIFFYLHLKSTKIDSPQDEVDKLIGGITISLKESLHLSIAVWLAIAGVIAYYFHIVTPVTIIANLIVVPLTSIVVVLGFGLLIAASFWPFLATCFALCLKVILNLIVGAIFCLAQIPYAYFTLGEFDLLSLLLYYVGLLAAYIIALRFIFRRKIA